MPANEIIFDESDHGSRFFLSGPFEVGFAMLLTPTCSMRAQQTEAGKYAHAVRSFAVIRPVVELIDKGVFDNAKIGLLRAYDSLINYMYIPEDGDGIFLRVSRCSICP